MDDRIDEKVALLDALIESLERDCEWPRVNVLLQRLLDARNAFAEAVGYEGL